MTKAEMVAMLRLHLNDEQKVGWEFDEELIEFLDKGVLLVSNILIRMKHHSMLKEITIDGETELPSDFVSFMGRMPFRIVGRKVYPYARIDLSLFAVRWDSPNIPKEKQSASWESPSGSTENSSGWKDKTTNKEFVAYYWARLPLVSSFNFGADVTYSLDVRAQIIDAARMFALNKNEFDITQDMAIFKQVQDAISGVNSGDEQ